MTYPAPTKPSADWAAIVADAYAAGAKPPLTDELVEKVCQDLRDAGIAGISDPPVDGESILRVNEALDAFELALEAVAGPRLIACDPGAGTVEMAHRSEAGRPLRSFGGQ